MNTSTTRPYLLVTDLNVVLASEQQSTFSLEAEAQSLASNGTPTTGVTTQRLYLHFATASSH